MTKNRPLVVVIDEEARETLQKVVQFGYFTQATTQRDRGYVIETPLGGRRKVTGTLIRNPNFREHTAEYLYLEITGYCNFACAHCGVSGDIEHVRLTRLIDEDARYITTKFIAQLAQKIRSQPFVGGHRNLFYGGGEPLINPPEFSRIFEVLSAIRDTTHIVSTNGCNLPLDYDCFAEFMQSIGNPYLFITVSKEHIRHYSLLHRAGHNKLVAFIPEGVKPENALEEKVKIIGEHCKRLGIGFTANVVEEQSSSYVAGDLRAYVISSAINIIRTNIDGRKRPCRERQEMAIRSNGDLYPHCYNIFTKTDKIGVAGLLVK